MSATAGPFFLASRAEWVPGRWLEAFPAGRVVAEVSAVPATHPPALVWLNTADPAWSKGLSALVNAPASAWVVVVSGMPASPEGLAALNQGARGYVHAYAVPALLHEVALVVGHGGLWVGPDLMQRLVGATLAALRPSVARPAAAGLSSVRGLDGLSAREAEVVQAVAAGRSNKEVAALMGISERTVKAHLGAVFEKLGVRDRLQLVLRLSSGPTPGPAFDQESHS